MSAPAPVAVMPLDECVKEVEPSTAVVLKGAFVPFLEQAKEWGEKAATVTDPKVARAAAAPDREKLHRLAELVLTIEVPADMSTPGGQRAVREIYAQITELNRSIMARAAAL